MKRFMILNHPVARTEFGQKESKTGNWIEYKPEYEEAEKMKNIIEKVFNIAVETPELNINNYDEDQVNELNEALIEIVKITGEYEDTCLYEETRNKLPNNRIEYISACGFRYVKMNSPSNRLVSGEIKCTKCHKEIKVK